MLRVIRAMELMKDTSLNITEIAYEVGHSNISAFSNTFSQLTNMRPAEFKAMQVKFTRTKLFSEMID